VIWQDCHGEQHLVTLSGSLFRLVESQQQVATLSLVDTLAEQALLEQLLEQTKPAVPAHAAGLHYLLKTPFRYPPLKWGSRFGAMHEPGIFYGGSSVEVCLAESAYYRLLFWHSIDAAPPKASLRTEHTLLTARYHSRKAVCLQQPPFNAHKAALTDKTSYQQTQPLGTAMRSAGVEVFQYCSARHPQQQLCIGLFSAAAFTKNQPDSTSQWLCELSTEHVVFKQAGDSTLYQFSAELFKVEGKLPRPG
jgi:hypothetical protein